jgi:nicotinamidase-related amidase
MIGTFSPADSALLLIDYQLGTMKLIKKIPLDLVRRNTLALAKTAKILNIPVVFTSSQERNVQGPLLPVSFGVSWATIRQFNKKL